MSQPSSAVEAGLSKSGKKLFDLVQHQIAIDPYEHDELKWLACHQDKIAKHLGVSTKTIARLIRKPPFRHLELSPTDKGRLTLIRIGDEMCTTDHQRVLATIWHEGIARFSASELPQLQEQAEELTKRIADLSILLGEKPSPEEQTEVDPPGETAWRLG